MRKRWGAAAAATLLLCLSLTGCAYSSDSNESSDSSSNEESSEREPRFHGYYYEDVPEEWGGGKVLCAWEQNSYSGGTSCDWVGYWQKKAEAETTQ